MGWVRVRFTIRSLLLIVAVVALLLTGGVMLRRRSERFGEIGVRHRRASEDIHDATFDWYEAHGLSRNRPPKEQAKRVDVERWLEYHELMTEKYLRAADYWWLPVGPDPPPPPGRPVLRE